MFHNTRRSGLHERDQSPSTGSFGALRTAAVPGTGCPVCAGDCSSGGAFESFVLGSDFSSGMFEGLSEGCFSSESSFDGADGARARSRFFGFGT